MKNIVTKVWGYELWIENNELYCGKHLHVMPRKWCSVHYHKNKKETFYVINGELLLEYSYNLDKEFWEEKFAHQKVLKKGDSFTLEPMIAHRFTSNDINCPCDFVEFSTHHEDSDSYRIIQGG